jgi:hypothetical protein
MFTNGPFALTGRLTFKWPQVKVGTRHIRPTALLLNAVTPLLSGTLNGDPGFTYTSDAGTGSFAGPGSAEIDNSQTAEVLSAECQGSVGAENAAGKSGIHSLQIGAGEGTGG